MAVRRTATAGAARAPRLMASATAARATQGRDATSSARQGLAGGTAPSTATAHSGEPATLSRGNASEFRHDCSITVLGVAKWNEEKGRGLSGIKIRPLPLPPV